MATNHLVSLHHHHPYSSSPHQPRKQHGENGAAAAAAAAAGAHQKGHQRRQSVARLLPDISKLRLLSWLVEASSELINCDIAIMDGVYAKLNKSQESLLFWSASSNAASAAASQQQQQPPPPPPRPSKQPVAHQSLVKMISEQQQQQLRPTSKRRAKTKDSAHRVSLASMRDSRNHHSLPLTNYDASSLAAVSLSPSLGRQSAASSSLSAATAPALAAAAARNSQLARRRPCDPPQPPPSQAAVAAAAAAATPTKLMIACDSKHSGGANNNDHHDQNEGGRADRHDAREDDHSEDTDQEDEEDDDGASSTTSSSGVGQGSLSSACSSSGSFSSSGSSSSSAAAASSSSAASSSCCSNEDHHHHHQHQQALAAAAPSAEQAPSSAERLSEKIRRTVMEHNHLQSLLVNIIRQHDKLRDQLNQQQQQRTSSAPAPTAAASNASGMPRHRPPPTWRPSATAAGPAKMPRIDLADIADALEHGCTCSCHSQRQFCAPEQQTTSTSSTPSKKTTGKRNSTLPALLSGSSSSVALAAATNKVRCLKKQRNTLAALTSSSLSSASNGNNSNISEQQLAKNRQAALSLLANKLCENCFETHYWLHGCGSLEIDRPPAAVAPVLSSTVPLAESTVDQNTKQTNSDAASSRRNEADSNQEDDDDHQLELNNALVAKRNATFIKLVQQETRSTLSKSIELIDLIRKEIKSPESIKHKQLMRHFSTSIQLLTSVGNYVVPSQDISAIIPEAGLQQQTHLFSLPSSDFDHLLMSGNYSSMATLSQINSFNNQHSSNTTNHNHHHHQQQQSNYHLALVPEIPIRRPTNLHARFLGNTGSYQPASPATVVVAATGGKPQTVKAGVKNSSSLSEPRSNLGLKTTTGSGCNTNNNTTMTTITKDSSQVMSSDIHDKCQARQRQASSKEKAEGAESSSGASSNNSSASSSIARGTVQQSSLTRAHTSNAILVGAATAGGSYHNHNHNHLHHHQPNKTSHDLSLERFANISRHHTTEDDLISPSKPKFWQSSKFNFIKKLLHVKQQRLLRQQSKDRRIYNNKVQNKFRLVMMDLTHFNKSQQLLTTENGVNSLLTSMRNVMEFGLYLTLKLY